MEPSRSEKIGNFIGEILVAFIFLGFCAGVLWLCWNYGLVNCTPLTTIKYGECFLVILAYRSITTTKIK